MDTEQLVAFQRVVREGTFSRAALTLELGQPALSARIQALEAQLGGALFTRGRRVALTPLGASFLPFVRRALETLEEGQRFARAAQRGERGRVSVACLGSLAGGLLGPALAEFVRVHPKVECHARSGDHELVLQQLWDGAVELGILVWPSGNASAHELELLSVFEEPVVLALSPEHPLAQKRSITRAELLERGGPLLKLRFWLTHEPQLLELAERAGTSLEIAMEAARHLVRRGAASGFFPRTYIAEDLEQKQLITLKVSDLEPLSRKLALVTRARPEALSPAAQDLVAAMKARASELGLVPGRKRRGAQTPVK